MADDLEKKLTVPPRRAGAPRKGPRFDAVTLLACGVGAIIAGAVLWAVLAPDPLGGEPTATAAIERRAPAALEHAAASRPTESHAPSKPAAVARDGVPIVRPGDPMPKSGPVIIRVPGADDHDGAGRAASQDEAPGGEVQTALLEETRYGALPRIAANGKRPLDVYARQQPLAAGARVALVVAGLGVGREATLQAIGQLPGEVSFAFSPYGKDVAELIDKARQDGHEILIQAPMEPFDYPANDPGPQTLLTSLPASANLERLRWSLGRASGYVGVSPLGGGRFLQAGDALSPVFVELARRGLMFLGPSSANEDGVAAAAEQAGLPLARAKAQIDAVAEAGAIDAALGDLEREAKAHGVAVGWASASPLTLKRIEAWRAGLSARGVALAPVSAAAGRQGPS
jgi:polysaccharide deacetylase 2 family uncharacterized protein YibQ